MFADVRPPLLVLWDQAARFACDVAAGEMVQAIERFGHRGRCPF
jgi:hypothetical protein